MGKIQRCAGLWIVAGDCHMEPGVFGQLATPTRLPGVLAARVTPTFRHGASVRRFDHFVVHRAVACQIFEVRVLEESGISPHHPVQVKLKRRGCKQRRKSCHRPWDAADLARSRQ